jgi:hypothetical protein
MDRPTIMLTEQARMVHILLLLLLLVPLMMMMITMKMTDFCCHYPPSYLHAR